MSQLADRCKVGQASDGIDWAFGMDKAGVGTDRGSDGCKIGHVDSADRNPQSRQGIAHKFRNTSVRHIRRNNMIAR